MPIYDAVLALLATITGIYFAARYPVLTNEFYFRQTETFIVGIIFIPLVIEALRRTAGLGLVTILSVFLFYGLFADLVPGQLEGRSQAFPKLISYLGVDLNAELQVHGRPIETHDNLFKLAFVGTVMPKA